MIGRKLRRQVELAHFNVAENRRQEVVEVVGNAAGQAPDALHLLGLLQLLLEGSSLGDVLNQAVVGDGRAVRAQPQNRRVADPTDGPVLAADAMLEGRGLLARQDPANPVVGDLAIFGHHQAEP